MEPIEEITMDLDEEISSRIIDSMNRRKGKMIDLKDTGKNKKRLIFHAPTRGLMGFTSKFLTQRIHIHIYKVTENVISF